MTGVLTSFAALAVQAVATPPATVLIPTSYDCHVDMPTPGGRADVMWRLLPDGQVISHSGNWSSTWRMEGIRLWVGWNGTAADPLQPGSYTSLAFGGPGPARSDRRRRVRAELRIPGTIGNIHAMAFATPYGRWEAVFNHISLNWGELRALVHGAERLEMRIVDREGRVRATAPIERAMVEEAERAAGEAQRQMIAMAAQFRTRCEAYFNDPYNRDIILT